MIAILKKEMFNNKVREILSYVPSAIFPAIIFPAILLDDTGSLLLNDNPKILAGFIAVVIGIITKNILATIFAGLISYWFIIFF
tara:strand:+ start:109 stop:360 length:252 start_codon:yes stop_codon:yes gene_type:complete